MHTNDHEFIIISDQQGASDAASSVRARRFTSSVCVCASVYSPLFCCLCAYSVRSGVDHFKHGRHVEAMNEYNKALDIDTNNVEALVARGAL